MTQGDKRHYKRRDVTTTQLTAKTSDERLIHIPLMMSERAWAYAMQVISKLKSWYIFYI